VPAVAGLYGLIHGRPGILFAGIRGDNEQIGSGLGVGVGVEGGARLIAVRDSVALDMVSALPYTTGVCFLPATAVLSGDGRRSCSPGGGS
jgi:hypothetical protein